MELIEKLRDIIEIVQREVKVMWKHLICAVIEAATEVCSSVRVGCDMRETAWHNEDVRKLVDEERV